MYLGEQMKEGESLDNEYKEFCIKNNIYNYYTQEELDHIIKTGKVTKEFNNMILDNLKLYCDIYVPKYASAFTNSKIHNGMLQIGVNDNGEITGIPYIGELNESKIMKLVENAKDKYLLNKVVTKVTVIKLKYHNKLIYDNSTDIVNKIEKHNSVYNMILEKYYFERKEWTDEVLKYSVRLSDIVKNEYTRKKFYIWLKKKKCAIYKSIILIKPKEIENIKNKRLLILNKSCIIHWIAMYKDESMAKLQSQKPENPNITKFYNSSVCLMTQLTNLRVKFFENNTNINFYKINICFDNINDNIYYRKINKQKIYKSYREEKINLGPYSVTLTH